ncbi:MAG TPA: Rieske 2Fe-2S domain-containing protein [Verrucomicrobiota bacterium]|nr:(2Fe-2S)-binding protein [Verrucomicrobiales bacterium]HRI11968.1 Rieske 2Fe-2S domain-containing protein [Verrucomicrobiota bacterium]
MADFVEVAKLEEVPPGRSTSVTAAGKDIALFHVDDTVYATDDKCLHAAGSLGFGRLEGKIVTCRLHAWRYDVTTSNMPIAPGRRLGCYPGQIVDGQV